MNAAARATPLGLGIIGCGGAAVDVVRAVATLSSVRVVGVHDRAVDRANELAHETGATAHATRRALLADPRVDAVYVALPHDLLVAASSAALRAGRHVLVEKPVATTLAGIGRLRADADTAHRSVGVMFELRHAGAAEVAATLVRGGALGRMQAIRIRTLIDKPPTYWASGPTGRVADPWRASRRRAGGGVVLMNAIHQLDVVRYVTGLEVTSVAAEIATTVQGVEVEDAAAAALRFSGGAMGSLVAAAHALGVTRGETIEIDGADGSLVIPDPYGAPLPVRVYLRRPWRDLAAGEWLQLTTESTDPWAAAIESFAAAVNAGTSPVPGIADAEAALATVLAIYRSARTGRRIAVHHHDRSNEEQSDV
ncbi:MAG: Gfo/Idh/MocA family protein [Chloroflexota bacterium]